MSDIVHIAKHGEPKLKILAAHLLEHVKLGWRECDPDPEPETYTDAKIDEAAKKAK